MKSRLFKKFFLTTAGIFLAGLTFLSAILAIFVLNYLVSDIRKDLDGNCTAVISAFKNDSANVGQLSGIVTAIRSISDADFYVIDPDGVIKSCSCDVCFGGVGCETSQLIVPQSVLDRALKEDFFQAGTLDGFYGNTYFFTSLRPLENHSGEVVGFVMSSTPASQIGMFFSTMLRMYILAAIIPTVLIFFAEYALSYRLMRPIRQMSDAARHMAKGDFSRRIPVVSDDEIGDLSISFNNMTNSLAKLESMRRSFVANVSHELRTPMTTISGFIDGMLDGTIDAEMQPRYLSIVSQEVKRLSRLVESMLCLAKLESGEQKSNPQNIDVVKITRNIIVSQEKRLIDKNLNVNGLDGDSQCICADYDLIYQVIYNLIDNALKFVDNNGVLDFNIISNNRGLTFEISNSGSFIPKEEIANIFERFYKVDKSRSVNKNGTGLGLYISKTIIEIHGGKIYADSKENEYTKFGFFIPNIQEANDERKQ